MRWPRSEWTAEEFERIADSWPNRLVLESAALDLYGQLTDGPLSATQLAERLGLEPRAARLFFDALAGLELLHKEEDRYSNSEAATRYLVEASPEYLGHSLIAGLDSWDLWCRLPDALRTGERQRRGHIFSEEPEAARHLLLAIHRRALTHAAALLKRGMVEPLGYRHMLDLGGGAGTYSIAFCRQNPELRSTLLDLPTAVALARGLVAASGLEDRIQASECDFERDDIPGSYDLIWVSNLLHGRSVETNQTLLRKLYPCVEADGELVVHDMVMEEDRTRPKRGAIFSVHMLLNNGVGRCYTYEEIRSWLEAAGFRDVRRVRDHGVHQLVIGRRAS